MIKNELKQKNSSFTAFKAIFDQQTDLELKLHLAIDFMETSLNQNHPPHFRSFWEVKRLCLPLFKENIATQTRGQLWLKYCEFSKEIRRLKEISDEQGAFTAEQIDIAIQALEGELTNSSFDAASPPQTEPLLFPKCLKGRENIYIETQNLLVNFSAKAARIQSLRQELLKTEMRVNHKNKLLHRLSLVADIVFPKRKEEVAKLSQQFSSDVDLFIKNYFTPQGLWEPYYVLREEIKIFQNLAKALFLNTESFTKTRMDLSNCWDQIKADEKKQKSERSEQRIVAKQHAEGIKEQLESLRLSLENTSSPLSDGLKKIDAIATQMREVRLERTDVTHLRELINEIRSGFQNKVRLEQETKQAAEKDKQEQKAALYQGLKTKIEELIQSCDRVDAEMLITSRDSLLKEIRASSLPKREHQELEKLLQSLQDIIADKKEKEILALPQDNQKAVQQLKKLLAEKLEQRGQIKNELQQLRKASGASNLDFEKAMNYTNQIHENKARMEKTQLSIQEIERKIAECCKVIS